MKNLNGKKCWLIGASEGLGRALAKDLHAEGVELTLSARNHDRLKSLCDELPGAQSLVLDVTDRAAVEAAADDIGQVDLVIYNVGSYQPMAAQAWDTDAILQMTSANYLGAVHVSGAILPKFLNRNAGEIIFIGSLSAYRGLPAALGYGPSKAALRSMAETLRYDLRDTGVTVKLVNPGFIRTRLTAKNNFKMPMLMEPETASRHVLRAIRKHSFRTDFPFPFSWMIKSLAILPDILVWRGK